MLVGRDDVHIVNDGDAGVLPSPASVVISTRIKPGQEARVPRMGATDRRRSVEGNRAFKAIVSSRRCPECRTTGWLSCGSTPKPTSRPGSNSPERQKLLQDANPFTEEFHARIVRTGFDQWFPVPAGGAAPPAVWKMNMLVLLMLYPIVFLFGFFVQTPFLTGRGLPFAIALFIGNIVSVVLLSYLVPRMAERFSWWLQPAGAHPRRIAIAGSALVAALYAMMLLAFWRLF